MCEQHECCRSSAQEMLTNGSFVNCRHFELSWTRACFPVSCPIVCSVRAGAVTWCSAMVPAAAAADPPDTSNQGDMQALPSSFCRFCMQLCLVFNRVIGVSTHVAMAVHHQAFSGLLSCRTLVEQSLPRSTVEPSARIQQQIICHSPGSVQPEKFY